MPDWRRFTSLFTDSRANRGSTLLAQLDRWSYGVAHDPTATLGLPRPEPPTPGPAWVPAAGTARLPHAARGLPGPAARLPGSAPRLPAGPGLPAAPRLPGPAVRPAGRLRQLRGQDLGDG